MCALIFFSEGFMAEDRITVTLKRDTAWILRNKLTLGPRFNEGGEFRDNGDAVYELRGMVNDALVALHSNPDEKDFPINITENQAWIIDQCIEFDGGGNRVKLLLQIVRGLWNFQHGVPELPVRTNKDPRAWWKKSVHQEYLPTPPEELDTPE